MKISLKVTQRLHYPQWYLMLKCYAPSNGKRNKQIEGKLNAQQMENEEQKYIIPALFFLLYRFLLLDSALEHIVGGYKIGFIEEIYRWSWRWWRWWLQIENIVAGCGNFLFLLLFLMNVYCGWEIHLSQNNIFFS